MCLQTVTREYKREKSGFGYKVFRVVRDELYSECCSRTIVRPVGVWLSCVANEWGEQYQPGFHLFLKRAAAARWMGDEEELVIKKVYYRGGHTVGTQWDLAVLVAREIKIAGRKKAAKK